MAQPLLVLNHVSKSYGSVPVLQDVNLQIHRGESLALIGENGAGKSTVSRIITGVTAADTGELWFEGQPVRFSSPRNALARGIAFIPQELAYIPEMSVADNLLLNQWHTTWGLVSRRATIEVARAECQRYGLDLGDVSRRMGALKLADRQLVEIVKALARHAKLIVLDEPTAALSQAESHILFDILGKLTQEGVAIVYISHRMDEVFDFSHKVAVLRNGMLVAQRFSAQTSPRELIADMLGNASTPTIPNHPRSTAHDPVLGVVGWSFPGGLDNITFSVARGEIVGFYGVRGSGADWIAEGLGGLHPEVRGAIVYQNQRVPVFSHPAQARRAGVAYVPAERKRNGLIMTLAIRANLTLMILAGVARRGMIHGVREYQLARAAVADFAVQCTDIEQSIAQLSGGNQQKVLLASRLLTRAPILVLHEPTRGVDIGARAQIHEFLRQAAQAGATVILVSSDLAEAVTLSHRLIVLRHGRIVGELSGDGKTQAAAIALAAGQGVSA